MRGVVGIRPGGRLWPRLGRRLPADPLPVPRRESGEWEAASNRPRKGNHDRNDIGHQFKIEEPADPMG